MWIHGTRNPQGKLSLRRRPIRGRGPAYGDGVLPLPRMSKSLRRGICDQCFDRIQQFPALVRPSASQGIRVVARTGSRFLWEMWFTYSETDRGQAGHPSTSARVPRLATGAKAAGTRLSLRETSLQRNLGRNPVLRHDPGRQIIGLRILPVRRVAFRISTRVWRRSIRERSAQST